MTPRLRNILIDQYRRLERRKAELGLPSDCLAAARNDGVRRTSDKIALLRAIERSAADKGVRPLFSPERDTRWTGPSRPSAAPSRLTSLQPTV